MSQAYEILKAKVSKIAVTTFPDSDRYKMGFGVKSASSDSIYKVSFDMSMGCWKCSCMGCIRHGQCKHLNACGLKGRNHGKDMETIRILS